MLLDNRNLKINPPTKLPTLLRANPKPKNFPRSDFKVDWFKNSAQIGIIIPIDKEYNMK